MSTRVAPLTLETLNLLPHHTRRCVFWEMDPGAVIDTQAFCDTELEKEAWLSSVLLNWGSCGQLLYLNQGEVAHLPRVSGCALYAPPSLVPRARLFPTSPVSADAILLTTLYVDGIAEAEGFHEILIRGVLEDLIKRGVRAIEAFGHIRDAECTSHAYSLVHRKPGDCTPETCMISAERLLDAEFKVVAPHHLFPRFRLELDRDHGWKADVEAALMRLLESSTLSMAGPSSPGTV
ncbi:hypothetical protein [Hoyosella altamirensis]|uniref:GNAT family N-acetyltransferase n=1 Tax=Hoyosella altamirensis TaxID=616997 RepID=A0A839RP66_9ACTN|nr:hypothetical protein [Hoyosella altamirensis]MBB3038099.1 hypothetical protein [Hoyosella altamirensis]